MQMADIEAAFGAINASHAVTKVSARYAKRLQIGSSPFVVTRIASLFRASCLDFLKHCSHESAGHFRQRAEAIEQALEVLGIKARLNGDFVLDKLKPADLENLDRHFLSLMSAGDGNACVNRAVTALAQMAIDLRREAMSYERYKGNIKFFYMVGRRFADAKVHFPSAGEAVAIYRILSDVVVPGLMPALPEWDARTNGNQIRDAMRDGGNVTASLQGLSYPG